MACNSSSNVYSQENEKYNPDGSELRRLQLRLSSMLKELDSFCKKYDIKYTLEAGTVLGAYRHKGFIPWDDDIDISMDLKEYKRFCKLLADNPTPNLRLQSHETDRLYLNPYAKVRDVHSSIKEQGVGVVYKENGCFIDVFPLEAAFPTLIAIYHILHKPLFILEHKALHKHRLIVFFANFYYQFLKVFMFFFRIISKLFGSKSYSYSYGSNLYTFKYQHRKEVFQPSKEMLFEGELYPVPGKTEEYLSTRYGKSYMQLPKEEDRISHHLEEIVGI